MSAPKILNLNSLMIITHISLDWSVYGLYQEIVDMAKERAKKTWPCHYAFIPKTSV